MVFSSQLRQFLQMIFVLDTYTGYILTSSPNCMMSSFVAMEILCIINVGSIFFKNDIRCCQTAVKMPDCNIFYQKLAELFEMYWKTFC